MSKKESLYEFRTKAIRNFYLCRWKNTKWMLCAFKLNYNQSINSITYYTSEMKNYRERLQAHFFLCSNVCEALLALPSQIKKISHTYTHASNNTQCKYMCTDEMQKIFAIGPWGRWWLSFRVVKIERKPLVWQ